MENELICLCDRPELIETATQWFHKKWGVPLAAYLESMNDSLTAASAVPRWYVMRGGNGEIIGGLGVFYCMATGNGEETPSRMYVHKNTDKH